MHDQRPAQASRTTVSDITNTAKLLITRARVRCHHEKQVHCKTASRTENGLTCRSKASGRGQLEVRFSINPVVASRSSAAHAPRRCLIPQRLQASTGLWSKIDAQELDLALTNQRFELEAACIRSSSKNWQHLARAKLEENLWMICRLH